MSFRLLVSIFCFSIGVSGCHSLVPVSNRSNISQKDILPFVSDSAPVVKYKATLDLYSKHFSGILVFKKTDSSTARLVFITEIGMKIVEYKFSHDSIFLVNAFPGIESRPKFAALLADDMGLIYLSGLYYHQRIAKELSRKNQIRFEIRRKHNTDYYYVDKQTSHAQSCKRKGYLFRKCTVKFLHYKEGKPGEVILKNTGVNLKIHLTLLDKD